MDKPILVTRIVINECKTQLRRRKTAISLADKLYIDDKRLSDAREETIDLEELLKKLDPADRLLIYMKYYMVTPWRRLPVL